MMRRDTRAKVEEDEFNIGNIRLLGVDYIIARILTRNKIPEDKFLISINDDGEVYYAIENTAGEFRLLSQGKVIGYYRRTLASEVIEDDLRIKPSLRRELTHYLKESGFIKSLK